MRRMIDAFSEYERQIIRARTKAALGVKKSKGQRSGNIPYGFRVADDGTTLLQDPGEQSVIARVREARRAGLTWRAIVAELGRPVTTTSANISGEGTLYASDEVRAAFLEKVELILDQGNLAPVQPSTIVDLQGAVPEILRHGPISEEQIQKAVEEFAAEAVATA